MLIGKKRDSNSRESTACLPFINYIWSCGGRRERGGRSGWEAEIKEGGRWEMMDGCYGIQEETRSRNYLETGCPVLSEISWCLGNDTVLDGIQAKLPFHWGQQHGEPTHTVLNLKYRYLLFLYSQSYPLLEFIIDQS